MPAKRKRSAPVRFNPSMDNPTPSKRPRTAPANHHIEVFKKMFQQRASSHFKIASVTAVHSCKVEKKYNDLAHSYEGKMVPLLVRSSTPRTKLADRGARPEGLISEVLGFHGTPNAANIRSICANGFRKPTKNGALGRAVYLSQMPHFPISVSAETGAIIGCKALAFTAEQFYHFAITDEKRVLPVCIIRFTRKPMS